MLKKFLISGVFLMLVLSLINIPITRAEELIDTLEGPWGNYDSSHTVSGGGLYTDIGYETGTEYREQVIVDCSVGIAAWTTFTQKCWHTTSWTAPHEDNFKFEFDYRSWGGITLQGLNVVGIPIPGFSTGWCNITVFVKVIDVISGSNWVNYERCVAAKSDILLPITQYFDEDVNFASRKCLMTEGTEVIIEFGIKVTTALYCIGLSAEECYASIKGEMDKINIYSDFDPTEPILCTDPDPPSHDFGEQYKGMRFWSFNVYNGGAGNLDYDIYCDFDWVTISIGIPRNDYWTHIVRIDTTNLGYGHHEATFTVEKEGVNADIKTGVISVDIINAPPLSPYNPTPSDGKNEVVHILVPLMWESVDIDGDPVRYDVYFGTDSPPSTKIVSDSRYNFTLIDDAESGTTYYWKVVAKDDHGHSSTGPIWSFTTNYPPNKPSTPDGTTNGKAGQIYYYTTSATDPDGGEIKYHFDWGDGTQSYTVFYNSGETATASHTFQNRGSYSIKVRAIDPHEYVSPWSDPLAVSMPLLKDDSGVNDPYGSDVTDDSTASDSESSDSDSSSSDTSDTSSDSSGSDSSSSSGDSDSSDSSSSDDTQSGTTDAPDVNGIYSLTININGDGTVTVSPDKLLYDEGEVVTLTANPDSGFVFDFWDGDLTGSNNPETITMTSDKTVDAYFAVDWAPPLN
jgi:hypothetical protein